jgi:hypothetical protein
MFATTVQPSPSRFLVSVVIEYHCITSGLPASYVVFRITKTLLRGSSAVIPIRAVGRSTVAGRILPAESVTGGENVTLAMDDACFRRESDIGLKPRTLTNGRPAASR